jgi:hypothetical protein
MKMKRIINTSGISAHNGNNATKEFSVNYRRKIALEDAVSVKYFHVTNTVRVLLKIAAENWIDRLMCVMVAKN